METTADIFIIGGGINGVGIAADASGRGLSVTLCEKGDLACATSSASSKLIHGGLRYLENYDFHLVRKALQEREVLLKKAPHLITPLEFVFPHDVHLRPVWLIRLGLFIYDHLAAHPLLPSSKKINLRKDPRGEALSSEFTVGFSYYDCFDDDARLVVSNALVANENNATILTRTECLSAEYENHRWKMQLKNLATGETFFTYAKVLVNAAGPWVAQVQKNLIHVHNPFIVNQVKGSHIIVPRIYEGDFAYILQNSDNRVVFTIPYQNKFTLIGTTDVAFTGDPSTATCSTEEMNYLCNTVNYYFKKTINPEDIVWTYTGVRCLQGEDDNLPQKITRDYKFLVNKKEALLTVISGKITTYRCLAEEAVDCLKSFFPHLKPAWTKTAILPGGDFADGDFEEFFENFKRKNPWLPVELAHRYARSYGTRVTHLLQEATSLTELGKHFGWGLYQKEVEYLMQQEWAKTGEDILWRRTKLGLFFTQEEANTLKLWVDSYTTTLPH